MRRPPLTSHATPAQAEPVEAHAPTVAGYVSDPAAVLEHAALVASCHRTAAWIDRATCAAAAALAAIWAAAQLIGAFHA